MKSRPRSSGKAWMALGLGIASGYAVLVGLYLALGTH